MRINVVDSKAISFGTTIKRYALRVETYLDANEAAQIAEAIRIGNLQPLDIRNEKLGNIWYGSIDEWEGAGLEHLTDEYNKQLEAWENSS
ncbi:MAG: hypothetical protein QM758_10765 [Armatimonas sp.]